MVDQVLVKGDHMYLKALADKSILNEETLSANYLPVTVRLDSEVGVAISGVSTSTKTANCEPQLCNPQYFMKPSIMMAADHEPQCFTKASIAMAATEPQHTENRNATQSLLLKNGK